MSININDINTVNDLLDAQEPIDKPEIAVTPEAEAIIKLILEEEPAVGAEICCRVIYALREFHAKGVELYIEEGKAEYSAQWASDHIKLDMALDLIKGIQV